ncbi:hypothetical protein DFH09DRAFT_1145840 [Mycena vulgaris]|nr:hypothetical protein DFH09DRAFT_1145840 [Mycena vulgaris]
MSAKKSSSSAKKVEPETFATREVVLAKVRGFPAWPGMIVDPASVPKAVSKERPASKKSVVYAVRFFPAGDYAWLPPKELKRLTPADIHAFVGDSSAASADGKGKAGAGARKSGELMEGYRKALDPVAWEEEHAANPPATKKRKSKSKAKKGGDGEEEDELADDAAAEDAEEEADEEEDEEKAAPAGKKRKRTGSPAPAKAKAKPKPGKAAGAKNGKKGGKAKKSKAAVESEDEGAADEGEEEGGDEEGEGEQERASKKPKVAEGASKLESDPEALKVREWRHKLQKTFLSSNNKSLPKEDEMPAVDTLFTTVEGYQNMNIDYLTFSKIGKVMRHIHLLEESKVPRDDEFNFRERAKALVDKWHEILNANKAPEAGTEGAAGTDGAEGGVARMDLNGAADGDLTVMDVTMDEA